MGRSKRVRLRVSAPRGAGAHACRARIFASAPLSRKCGRAVDFSRPPAYASEGQLSRELNHAYGRIEAQERAVRAGWRERHPQNLSECGVAHAAIRVREIGVVEHVECLRSHGDLSLFAKVEGLV